MSYPTWLVMLLICDSPAPVSENTRGARLQRKKRRKEIKSTTNPRGSAFPRRRANPRASDGRFLSSCSSAPQFLALFDSLFSLSCTSPLSPYTRLYVLVFSPSTALSFFFFLLSLSPTPPLFSLHPNCNSLSRSSMRSQRPTGPFGAVSTVTILSAPRWLKSSDAHVCTVLRTQTTTVLYFLTYKPLVQRLPPWQTRPV